MWKSLRLKVAMSQGRLRLGSEFITMHGAATKIRLVFWRERKVSLKMRPTAPQELHCRNESLLCIIYFISYHNNYIIIIVTSSTGLRPLLWQLHSIHVIVVGCVFCLLEHFSMALYAYNYKDSIPCFRQI